MDAGMELRTNVGVSIERTRPFGGAFSIKGVFHIRCLDGEGVEKWRTVAHNMPTTQGLDYMLNAGFHNATVVATWRILLMNGASPANVAGDTYASHAGWTEFTSYNEAARPDWNEGASSGGTISSSTTSDFTINSSGTVGGIATVSVNTKGDTTTAGGVLWATARFPTPQSVVSSDVLKINYSITASSTDTL